MTLAEVLVGMFVLACGVLAVIAAEIYLARSERGTRGRQEASFLASNLMNERLALDFSLNFSRPRTPVSDHLSYALDEHLTAADLKEITVSIYFLDSSEWRQYDLSTCLCNAQ